jgi:MFS transporter, NNP family, nitrate/nitrite transporter
VILVSWVCLLVLSIPGVLSWPVFTALLFVVGLMWAFGKASVFKHIADDYPEQIGVISGIVGLVGGLGGFVFPILFGVLLDVTGVRSSAFMLLFGVTTVSVILLKGKSHGFERTDILESGRLPILES